MKKGAKSMYLELFKIDFLDLEGKITSFTLTPQKNKNGTNKVRVDSVVEYRGAKVQNTKVFGSYIIYNYNDCNLEKTETPPNINFYFDKKENSICFEYRHMYIPLRSSARGYVGLWNLILPAGWRITELYLSDPFDKNKDVKKKKQFNHKLYWDKQNHIQSIEMELRSVRGSFSFIVKGKAINISNIIEPTKENLIPSDEDNYGFGTLEDISLSHSKGEGIIRYLQNNNLLELKPNIGGLGVNINEIINYFLKKSRSKDS